jgi:hypothetical protein
VFARNPGGFGLGHSALEPKGAYDMLSPIKYNAIYIEPTLHDRSER